jgi:hypothetical protein
MIQNVSGGYRVVSENGKNLGGPYRTKKEAEKRLEQVEFFKHNKEDLAASERLKDARLRQVHCYADFAN